MLRCLEIEPVWRYPTAAQLAFDLEPSRPGQAHRARRAAEARSADHGLAPALQSRRDAAAAEIRCRRATRLQPDRGRRHRHGWKDAAALHDALRVTAGQVLATLPSARLACLNVLKLNRLTVDRTLDEQGRNKHIDRMVALQHWAQPLKLDESRLTVHVLEAFDPADAILEFARRQPRRSYRDRRTAEFVRALVSRQRVGQGRGRGAVHGDGGAAAAEGGSERKLEAQGGLA